MGLGERAHVPLISFSATSPYVLSRTRHFVQIALSDDPQVGTITAIVESFLWSSGTTHHHFRPHRSPLIFHHRSPSIFHRRTPPPPLLASQLLALHCFDIEGFDLCEINEPMIEGTCNFLGNYFTIHSPTPSNG
ncbi:hypothetical protein HYC85_007450 [Camellia sinensis]|uniref:Receptor ligand binding region domain-containing protein n=1 Tax=Camellia sinensis TaxID=4442 RepID=A0A7J7HRF0_CAMSI|nr:hypothetical protein HYC85_007450 [Camellia sinensis]